MLIRKHDAALDDEEWRAFLASHDFGELIAAGRGHDVPVVVPTHFLFDGMDRIALHLARPNPVWERIRENPLAIVSVFGAYTYIPTAWNVDPPVPPEQGVPTSYYAAVQAICRFRIVDDAEGLAAILREQLGHLQPEGGHEPVDAYSGRYGALLPGIRGLRGEVVEVRAKFKFGGNREVETRERIAAALAARGAPRDDEARAHLVRRLERTRT
ncbi:MAG TPA: FMN-binding negative transcriptional regulator [Candidatus Limnocylindria bacterium]|nr:FMN-binding negative transcriptional regulator [Candidatus Limnocylindria bacterium]